MDTILFYKEQFPSWDCTDSSTMQFRKKVDTNVFILRQLKECNNFTSEFRRSVYEDLRNDLCDESELFDIWENDSDDPLAVGIWDQKEINLNTIPFGTIESYITAYYKDLAQLINENSISWKEIIAECIFESTI